MYRDIEFLPLAKKDLLEITAYYEERNNRAADKFKNAVVKITEFLCQSPETGTLCRFDNPNYAGTRVRTLPRPFNDYLIFYRLQNTSLQILRLMYGSKDYSVLFET
jgi:addiction module RelE/StbE family toxin